jgi:uncharacterized membrane protein YphA (DoxX/SURF4 family)
MAYSHSRLRNTLAVVRIVMGALFLFSGAHKIWSLDFARMEFPKFLRAAIDGAGIAFYADFLSSVVWPHYSEFAVLIALIELFIAVGLLLGLAVRPVSLVGMLYTAHLILATWMAPGLDQPLWRYLENETSLIMMFSLFVILGVGHAGENWGVGSLYHGRRRRKWEEVEPDLEADPARESGLKMSDFEREPALPPVWRTRSLRNYRTEIDF